MGMFIRVKGKAAEQVEQLLVNRIPHHSCGMLGSLPSESFGALLAGSFPKAMTFASGDALTVGMLRVNADKLRPQDLAKIAAMPRAYMEACAFLRGLDQQRCATALQKMAKHYGAEQFQWISVHRMLLASSTSAWDGGVKTNLRVLRKVLRKDELKALLKVQSL